MSEAENKAKVLEFARRPFAAVAAVEDGDGKGARLLEPRTGKELHIRWGEIARVEQRVSPLRPAPYLVLLLEDGRQVALADVGFAFAPSTVHTGPLPDLPATFCFADLVVGVVGRIIGVSVHSPHLTTPPSGGEACHV
jgi:hypothetical protein